MTSGFAENLVDTKGEGTEQNILDRTACGTESISDDGSGVIKVIKGKTVKWNQKAQITASQTEESNGVTMTVVFPGMIKLNGTASEDAQFTIGGAARISEHKYAIMTTGLSGNTSGIYINWDFSAAKYIVGDEIYTAPASGGAVLRLRVGSGTVCNNTLVYVEIIDLTDIFGTGNEPSTVADFEAWMAANLPKLDYFPYTTGTLINNAAHTLETVGFNQWDEQWEVGGYQSSTGEKITRTNKIRSTNRIKVFGGETYFMRSPGAIDVYSYDCGGRYVGVNTITENTTFTLASNVAYIAIGAQTTYGTTYNHDICINLSWSGYRNGEYEPYWKHEMALNLDSFDVKDGQGNVTTIHGLKQAGSVYDEIKDGKFIQRVGVVDLGTLDWGNYADESNTVDAALSGCVPVGRTNVPNILSSNYVTKSYESVNNAGAAISLHHTHQSCRLSDSSLSGKTGAQVATALSGVMLYYELATPVEYELVNPINTTYKVADFCTERIVPQTDANGNPTTTAFRAVIKYNNDFTAEIRNLPTNYVRRDALKQSPGQDTTLPLSQKAVEDNYARKVGEEDKLTSGLAKNLIDTKGQGSEQSFTRRTSCGNESIADDGNALFKKLMGKSLVWNQLVQNGDFADGTNGWTTNYSTLSVANNIASFTASAAYGGLKYNVSFNWTAGHKYLISVKVKTSFTAQYLRVSSNNGSFVLVSASASANIWTRRSIVATNVSGDTDLFVWDTRQSDWDEVQISDLMVVDLTLMFGAGNEPSTVAEFEAMFPLPYYAYNAGKIIDNKVSAYETVGFNQWDEQWEVVPTQWGNVIFSKNYIQVIPNNTYYFHVGSLTESQTILNGYRNLQLYDSDYNSLPAVENISILSDGKSFVVNSNVHYIKFFLTTGYGTTYKNDICINLSWSGYRNGEYEPYWKNTLPLGLNSFKVTDGTNEITVTGLKSAGSVYDEIDLVRKKYIKRVGSVDLGTLAWSAFTSYVQSGVFVASLPSDAKTTSSTNNVIVASGYHFNNSGAEVSSGGDNMAVVVNNGYFPGSNPKIGLCNNSKSNSDLVDGHASWLEGVILYYELAEPIEYDLVDEIQTIAPCADFGTEYAAPTEEVDANGVPKSAPFRAQIKYSDDFTRILARRNQDLQNQESMDAFVSMLGGVLNGTITKTWDATNKKYTYSFTANE